MRTARLLLLALPALALSASPSAAQWETTAWEIRCTAGSFTVVGSARPVPCEEHDGGRFLALASFYEQLLQSASRFLQGFEFKEPRVPPASPTRWSAIIDESETGTLSSRSGPDAGQASTKLGVYECPTRALKFPSDQYHLSEGSALLDSLAAAEDQEEREGHVGLLWTPPHELFHAIQAAELGGADAACEVLDDESIHWITEGTAEAVGSAWAERHLPPLVEEGLRLDAERRRQQSLEPPTVTRPGMSGTGGIPSYTQPITDPFNPYNLWHFWISLGEELESRDDIEYIRDLLRQPNLRSDKGVSAVEATLEIHGTSLYDLYPQVIAEYAWQDWFYHDGDGGVQYEEIELRPADRVDREGTVAPLASAAHRVTIPPLEETVEVHISLSEADRARENLHLIVHDIRTDDRSDEGRNVFREPIGGTDTTQRVMVRVANVGRDPTATPADGFDIRFELTEPPVCEFIARVEGERSADYSGAARFSITDQGFGVVLSNETAEPTEPRVSIHVGSNVGADVAPGSYEIDQGSLAVLVGGSGTNPGSYSAALDRRVDMGSGMITVDEVSESQLSGSVQATLLDMGDGAAYTLTATFTAARGGTYEANSPYRTCASSSGNGR